MSAGRHSLPARDRGQQKHCCDSLSICKRWQRAAGQPQLPKSPQLCNLSKVSATFAGCRKTHSSGICGSDWCQSSSARSSSGGATLGMSPGSSAKCWPARSRERLASFTSPARHICPLVSRAAVGGLNGSRQMCTEEPGMISVLLHRRRREQRQRRDRGTARPPHVRPLREPAKPSTCLPTARD